VSGDWERSAMTHIDPLGNALLDFSRGVDDASITLEYRDGRSREVPASVFFRGPEAFFDSERVALQKVCGSVLDVGAGAGIHTLALQNAGYAVTAIDTSPGAVEVMKKRGVTTAGCEDFFSHQGRYDTILLLGLNIGICGELRRLPDLLTHCGSLLRPDGRVIGNSVAEQQPLAGAGGNAAGTDAVDGGVDTAGSKDESSDRDHSYRGAYRGDLEFRVRYGSSVGPWTPWLHVDCGTLSQIAAESGWRSRELARDPEGSYSVVLTPSLQR
jgi:SAM-dependent methyltransferase